MRHLGKLAALVLCSSSLGCVGGIGGDDAQGGGDGPPDRLPNGRFDCSAGPYPVATAARRLSQVEYKNVIRDVFGGAVAPSAKYPGSYGKSATGYSTEAEMYDVGAQNVEQIMFAAEEIAEAMPASLPTVLPCSTAPDAGEACFSTFVDDTIYRAYRRPVTAEERADLLATYQGARDSGASFVEAMAMVTAHALQTPQFLYITEAAAPDPRALDGYEAASRLSFYLWQTIPDEALFAKAASGALSDPEVRREEARRMLADPRAEPVLARFFREWSETEDVVASEKDPGVIAGFDDAYAQAMSASFDHFAVAMGRDGTLADVLGSDKVWVDATMAGFFGVPAPTSEWSEVSVEHRSGLMTQPLFLASAAHRSDSSYVFRGRFVQKRLRCLELGAPPGNAQLTFDGLQLPEDPTGKDKSAQVNGLPACTGCHSQLDPVGLAFEHYGALGEYRETYASGKPIDPSGETSLDGETLPFGSPEQLLGALATDEGVAQCMGRQVVRFAMSRSDTDYDGCAAQGVGDLVSQGLTLGEALVEMAASDSFGYRLDY